MHLKFHLHYWPILTAFWMFFTFLTSYLVAVFNGHVRPFFPYISDTGTTPPDSCVFGQMLNIEALLMLITVYVRFRTVKLLNHKDNANIDGWNSWSVFFGCLTAFGVSVVANFQETSQIHMHGVGAFLSFGVGGTYLIIEACLTWMAGSNTFLKCWRTSLSALALPLYVSGLLFSVLSFQKFDGQDPLLWEAEHSGYAFHLVGTFSEWLMATVMILFVASFYVEFKQIEFEEISFILKFVSNSNSHHMSNGH